MTTPLEAYYNKFNEDKRLNSRHGRVEFEVSMSYIHRYLDRLMEEHQLAEKGKLRILDIGAGTGRYSIPLSEEGYDVSAVELVKHNLGRIRMNGPLVKARQGNALNLKKYEDASFDLALLFGPMYHLSSKADKVKALKEALRVVKPDGYVLVAYIMNDYAILTYAFKEQHLLESLQQGMIDENFHCVDAEENLYSYVRLEDIDACNQEAGAIRCQIIGVDGAANYMRRELNALNEEEFEWFVRYQMSICERQDMIGASAHTVDVIRRMPRML